MLERGLTQAEPAGVAGKARWGRNLAVAGVAAALLVSQAGGLLVDASEMRPYLGRLAGERGIGSGQRGIWCRCFSVPLCRRAAVPACAEGAGGRGRGPRGVVRLAPRAGTGAQRHGGTGEAGVAASLREMARWLNG